MVVGDRQSMDQFSGTVSFVCRQDSKRFNAATLFPISRAFAFLCLAVFASHSCIAEADTIPYPTPGTQNPTQYTFTATQSGDITAYFVGTGAEYTETLGMLVNGVSTGITGLENHNSSYGQSLNLGYANAGDTLVFYINVLTTGNTWYSHKA